MCKSHGNPIWILLKLEVFNLKDHFYREKFQGTPNKKWDPQLPLHFPMAPVSMAVWEVYMGSLWKWGGSTFGCPWGSPRFTVSTQDAGSSLFRILNYSRLTFHFFSVWWVDPKYEQSFKWTQRRSFFLQKWKNQWDFQGPPTMGPPYGKLPIILPYHSHKNP